MSDWRRSVTHDKVAYLEGLGEELSRVLEKSNKPLVDAINNLAMNTGNKTTREYNELKKKYTELENNFKKSDCLLKSIITMYTFVVFNHNYLDGSLNSDRIVKIMDQMYADIQNHRNGFMPDVLYENIINIGNEVFEKLMRR